MSEIITILVADDHPLVQEGLAAVIAGASDLRLVASAATGQQALEQFRAARPDVTLLDIQMPDIDGLETLRRIRREAPAAHVLVLTTFRNEAQVRSAFEAGAAGFLLKSVLPAALRDAIRHVHAGRRVIPPEIAVALASSLSRDTLTEAELAALRLVAAGHSNKQVGQALNISEETVKTRMKALMAKLGAADRTHAVVLAARRGLIEVA